MKHRRINKNAWVTNTTSADGAIPVRQSPDLTAAERTAIADFPARRFEGGGFREMAVRTLEDAGHKVEVYTRLNGIVWKIDGRRLTGAKALDMVNRLRRKAGKEPLTLAGGGADA